LYLQGKNAGFRKQRPGILGIFFGEFLIGRNCEVPIATLFLDTANIEKRPALLAE
jgi:hypothetical protein